MYQPSATNFIGRDPMQWWIGQVTDPEKGKWGDSLEITKAGDVISVKLIKTMAGNDEWLSGYYLIKDLRHTVHFRDTGVQCYTYLRLVRDTPGDD